PQVEPEWRRELARLLPEVSMGDPTGDLPDPITEGWQRQRFFEGTARALLVDQPLRVVIDDLQWCDKESLEWFHFLTRVDPATPMLLLGTVRTEETDASHPLHRVVASWRHTGMIMEIDVPPLDQRETTRLAASIVNAELDEGTAARLFQETEGNPLFTLEIARAGLLGDRGDARLSLPSRVQEVIRARLSTLSTEARELVGVAATIGRAFDFRLLLRIQAKDEGSLIRHLDELWQRRIIREHGADAYDFSHGKLREVAYEELSAAKRRWLHRKVADALEELHAADLDKVSGQIASHFEQAGVPELAIPYYERAAAAAHRIYANEATVAYYQRLLPLTKGAVRITFMRRLANVWQQTGGWALAEEMFRKGLALAEEEGYQEERAECQIGLGFVLRLRGSYAEALRVLADARRAFEELGLKRGISRAVGNMGVVYFELADYTRALSLFELQWEMAHDLSDPAEMRNAMRDMGLVHWAQGDYAQALACHERHLRLAEAHGDHRGVGGMNALNNMGLVYRAQGEYERALGCHQESLNIAREIQNRRGIGVALGNIGIDYEEQGDYLKAFDYLQQQLAIAGELGDRRSESHATWHLGNICEAFGRFRDALDCFAYQLSIAAEIDDRRVAAIALGNVARVFAADGREEEGERLFRASLSLLRELRLPHYICETQYRLADLSLRLLQVAQAEREAAEAFQTAAALKRTPIQFAAELLTVRVELATCQVDPAGTEARLRQLIARYLHPRQQAAAHYELWKLTKTEESRQAAAALYKELFATIPRIEYRRRHHELTGETLPEAPRLPPLPEIITRHQVNLDEALRRVDRLLVPTAS
ncbi:MAG: ATP-binding protein, partial [Armatimonadota bacterium]